jgi:hypothetical protein
MFYFFDQSRLLTLQEETATPHDENANEQTKAAAENHAEDSAKAAETLIPAFPNGRRVSNVQTQCCNGFKTSGVCNLL